MQAVSCSNCGAPTDPLQLVPHYRGKVCLGCDELLATREREVRSLWAVIVSGPIGAVLGFMLFCVPLVGAVLPVFVAMAVVGVGVRALTESARFSRVRDEYEIPPGVIAAGYVSGAASIAAGGTMLVLGVLVAILTVMTVWGGVR